MQLNFKFGALLSLLCLGIDSGTKSATTLVLDLKSGEVVAFALWLKQNEPANFRRLTTALLPHDFLKH